MTRTGVSWPAAAVQAIEARVVEDAGVGAPLPGRGGAECGEPLWRARALPGRVDHQGRGDGAAVRQADAGHGGAPAVAPPADQALRHDALTQLDPWPSGDARAQRPLEGRAPAGEEDAVIIVGARRERDAGRRHLV